MKIVILAHGGHIAVFFMPVVAIAYLVLMLKGERVKRSNPGTPRLPTDPFSRQVHTATTSPKAKEPKKAAPPVPATFMPSKAKRTTGIKGVPLHLQPRPKPGSGPSSSSGETSTGAMP
jgi:hypothetical protein